MGNDILLYLFGCEIVNTMIHRVTPIVISLNRPVSYQTQKPLRLNIFNTFRTMKIWLYINTYPGCIYYINIFHFDIMYMKGASEVGWVL